MNEEIKEQDELLEAAKGVVAVMEDRAINLLNNKAKEIKSEFYDALDVARKTIEGNGFREVYVVEENLTGLLGQMRQFSQIWNCNQKRFRQAHFVFDDDYDKDTDVLNELYDLRTRTRKDLAVLGIVVDSDIVEIPFPTELDIRQAKGVPCYDDDIPF